MERYIIQLIEDLEKKAKNPPPQSYIEPPGIFEDDPETYELALVPYKTIEELTGIKQEEFPLVIDLDADQCKRVNKAIFKVFDSLKIELVDAPDDLPSEILYEALTTNWDYPVQHLPSSGMDLELCTGDPENCPYGEFCDCSQEFDEFEIPEKFAVCINSIAQSLEAGLICYLNPETMEIEEIPKYLNDNPHEHKWITGISLEDQKLKRKNWNECYVFTPIESGEWFKMMEIFTENIDDEILRQDLSYALSHNKPFANFRGIIQSSDQSDNWQLFKMKRLEDHVKEIIYRKIHKIPENFDENDLPF